MVKISRLEIENVKKVRAVEITPNQTGLTTIGGKNAQGKTSILDAIAYALGGERYRPSNLQREGSAAEASIKVQLSNGLIVERSGKNASLKVTDPEGLRSGQRLLDSFVEELALNLPKFLDMNAKDKANVLLSILGIEEELQAIDDEEKAIYDERHAQGRIADQKEKFALELVEWHDVPEEPLTSAKLVEESQAIMQRNAEKQTLRNQRAELETTYNQANENCKQKSLRVQELEKMLEQARIDEKTAMQSADEIAKKLNIANQQEIPADESTAEVEAKLNELEEINAKVRANLDKQKAILDAEQAREVYNQLSIQIDKIRRRRLALLEGANLPLPGLSIIDGELAYNGQKWDCMSQMEQFRVAIAIVKQRKPNCGFVLLDKLESFDDEQLQQLSQWLETENLQAIATRVSTGDECTIIIEDGLIVASNETTEVEQDF